MITLIAAIGNNNELGFENNLLWHIPEDLAHFKAYTIGKIVVMGRKTFQSIGRALPGRKNVVLSSVDLGNTVIRANSIETALSIEHCYPEIVIIGGAKIYAQTIGLADKLVITHVDTTCIADTYFPKIDMSRWKEFSSVMSGDLNYRYRTVEYVRENK